MKYLSFFIAIFFYINIAIGQIAVTANADDGSGYDVIMDSGLDIETPDCVHTDFGPHITQSYNETLEKVEN